MLTKEKGDIAVSHAIGHFMSNGYEVCLPIGDKRDYDIVIEKGGILERVQVKYAGLYPGMKYCKAALRITGGNRSFHTAKRYDSNAFDTLFIHTFRGNSYVIPWSQITARNELSIDHPKYDIYKVA